MGAGSVGDKADANRADETTGHGVTETAATPTVAAGAPAHAWSGETSSVPVAEFIPPPDRRPLIVAAALIGAGLVVGAVMMGAMLTRGGTTVAERSPVEVSPAAPTPELLNGTYRIAFDTDHVTFIKDGAVTEVGASERDPVSVWSFTSTCTTAADCTAVGTAMNSNEYNAGQGVVQEDRLRIVDGVWASVNPHRSDMPCPGGPGALSVFSWWEWTPAGDVFRGVEVKVMDVLVDGGCGLSVGKHRVETPFTAAVQNDAA